MSTLLESIAVARRYEEEAAEILGAYINTQPQMAYNYSHDAAPARAPTAAAPGPGSSGAPAKAAAKTTAASDEESGDEESK